MLHLSHTNQNEVSLTALVSMEQR